jgi:hypothetical protein
MVNHYGKSISPPPFNQHPQTFIAVIAVIVIVILVIVVHVTVTFCLGHISDAICYFFSYVVEVFQILLFEKTNKSTLL